MCTQRDIALAGRLEAYDRLVEVGIGTRTSVATEISKTDSEVIGVDVNDRSILSVRFVQDDVTDPETNVYAETDAIYGLRLPPELHRPTWQLARAHDSDFLFTTLGLEPPNVPATPEQLPGTTLYRARADAPGGSPRPERY
jgi:hypothetical protein